MPPADDHEHRLGRRGLILFARRRLAQGWQRARSSTWPIAEAAVAAGLVWLICTKGWGHPAPFFGPIAAWICLGFRRSRELRMVGELAVGVTLGVALGDLFVQLIGTGPVQIAAVLFLGGMTARLVDRGGLVATQAGAQSLIIVSFPVAAGISPVSRWTDALTGGLVALAVTILVPHDPRKPLRDAARQGLAELAEVCSSIGRGLRKHDLRLAADALVRGRASQDVLNDWFTEARRAQQLVTVSPRRRTVRLEVEELAQMATFADRAMRNARVVARRGEGILRLADDLPEALERVEALAAATEMMAAAVRQMSQSVYRPADSSGTAGPLLETCRSVLLTAAGQLTADLAGASWQPRTYVLLLRSMAVDLLQACGLSRRAAVQALPAIGELSDLD